MQSQVAPKFVQTSPGFAQVPPHVGNDPVHVGVPPPQSHLPVAKFSTHAVPSSQTPLHWGADVFLHGMS